MWLEVWDMFRLKLCTIKYIVSKFQKLNIIIFKGFGSLLFKYIALSISYVLDVLQNISKTLSFFKLRFSNDILSRFNQINHTNICLK